MLLKKEFQQKLIEMVASRVDQDLFLSILNSIQSEIVFCDVNHTVLFINDHAKEKYKDSGLKIGDSIFSCHKKEDSHRIIKESFARLEKGENRTLLYKSEKTGPDVYLVAVRDNNGKLLGYWEQESWY
ncbi:MAG: PAS domain-containing protein [Candidatus Hodarchaeales archaeon]